MMLNVDARGDACPLPVVKAKKAISELKGAGEVEVLVDNEIAVQNRWRSCWAISTVKPMCGVRATTSFCAAAGRIPTGWPGSGMTAIPSCRPLMAGGMLRTRLPKNALTRSGAPRRCRCTAAGWYSAENRSLGSPTMRAF